jgi:hypothetical protein
MIGKNLAVVLGTATLTFALLCQPGMAAADEVAVTKNGTPLMLSPLRDAPTEWKVNSGFPLTVLEQRGDWLKVRSAQLPKDSGELWVRADRVAAPGGESAANSELEKPIAYRIELTGTPDMKFRLECRTLHDGEVSFRPHINRLPQSYEYSGDAVSCVAWKKQHYGMLQVTLVEIYPTKERVLGRVATREYPVSIFARSPGPGYPTSLFPSSNTPWRKAAVVLSTDDDLILPLSGS